MTRPHTTLPFNVLGIQQIAIGGHDKGRLIKLWVDMFGGWWRSQECGGC